MPSAEEPPDGDVVEEASAESFPASDPPSFAAADADDAAPARGRRAGRRAAGRPTGLPRRSTLEVDGAAATIRTGSVAIAAITSCTNTSNPTVMVGAGLLARNAVARGLRVGADGQDLARARARRPSPATSRRPA